MAPLARDVMIAYSARKDGIAPAWQPLTVQYADYSLWQREVLGSEDDSESLISQQISYWTETLADLPDVIELPSDRSRPDVASMRGERFAFEISGDVHRRLDALARENNATLFMALHSALAVLMARLSGTSDIAVGTPVAGSRGRGARRSRRYVRQHACSAHRGSTRPRHSRICWLRRVIPRSERSLTRTCPSSGWWTSWLPPGRRPDIRSSRLCCPCRISRKRHWNSRDWRSRPPKSTRPLPSSTSNSQ